ncbi:MAG: RluA family pseudouridine synthase [Lachnospiraceae bacterium]|nr:RluA family pseudouridine synthase [Lachnospiraceae bacterium]
MKEFHVTSKDAGQRFSKYLGRLLPNAGSGFVYKMLRKKNITLNDEKADGSETIREGDTVKLFLSDETFAKMSGQAVVSEAVPRFALRSVEESQIVYEDGNFLCVYKPAGVLSQKDDSGTEALNEQILQYLADRGDITAESIRMFKPGICNRLDRNTSGILWFAKTLAGSRGMAEALRGRMFGKFYYALLLGTVTEPVECTCYLRKDEATNRVTISETPEASAETVHTGIEPVVSNRRATLARIRLYTGKSHQIRSVCQHLGHPVVGDPKYGAEGSGVMSYFHAKYHSRGQQLFAYSYAFPEDLPAGLTELEGETITGIVPETFSEIVHGEFPDFADSYC